MTNIQLSVKALVEAKAGVTVTSMDQNLREDLALDSLDIVELILEIDKEFGVDIPDSVWEAASVTTVQNMATVVTNIINK